MENKRHSLLIRCLAVFCSLIMIFSSVSLTAFAEDITEPGYMAAIGETVYETLQDAVDAAEGETEITLLKNAEGDGVVVEEGKDIIFDFGGHTYTVTGELVGSSGTKTLGMQLLKGAKVTLRNGTLKADKHVKMLVQNYCDLTLENFNLDVTGVDYEYAYALSNNNGNILVTGESNISSDYCAFDLWYGFMGAYLDGVSVTFDENYTGTVTGNIEYGKDSRADVSDWLDKTSLVIENGNFEGAFISTSEFDSDEANITVYGGSFSDKTFGKYCDDEVKLDNDGSVISAYFAAIGDTKYTSLQDAVDAAEGETVITLLRDDEGDGVVVEEGKDIIFDFDGHTYTVTGELVGSAGTKTLGMQLLKGAKVTLRNGTLKADKHVKMLVQNYCDLTLENFNLDVTGVDYEYAYALSNNNGNILVTGESNISSDYCAFDLWYGFMGAYLDGVSVTFDENYTGTVTGTVEYGKDSRADVSDWLEKTPLIIENGTFNGSFVATSGELEEANIVITGGKFSDSNASLFCDDDYKLDSDGQVVERYIAASGESKFETLQEAVDAAEGETEITLLKNAEGDGVVVEEGKDIIFDFGGHTYTVTGELVGSAGTKTLGMQLLKGAKVTLRNGTLKADKHVKMLVQNYCDLTLESFNLDVTGVDYEYAYALSNNNGNILVTGESNISSDYCAFDLWYGFMGAYLDGVSVTFDENYTGTVTGTVEYGKDSRADVSDWLDKTSLVIENGIFDGEFVLTSEFYPNDANITVSGGKFVAPLENGWRAEGYSEAVFDDGYYGVCIHEFTQQIKDEEHLVSECNCTDGSVYYYDCAYCVKIGRATYNDNDALGHSFTKYIYANNATCTENGTATAICDREGCSEKSTKSVDGTMLGHSFGAWVVTENASCIKNGIKERTCSICSYKEAEEIVVSHVFSNIRTVDKVATCTENGSESYNCIICGEKTDVKVIPATGHKNSASVTPATIKADGAVITTCSVCKETTEVKISKIASVTTENTKYDYTGKDITPPVTVKDTDGKVLKEGTDFTVVYKDNKAVGKAAATVTFKGNYSGTQTLEFSIIRKTVSAVTGLKAEMEKNSIAVTFNAVKGAAGYEVSVYNEQTKKYDLIATVRKTRYVLKRIKGKKFTAGTTYKIRVVAIMGSGSNKVSSKARTTTVTTPLQKAEIISAVSSKAKRMQVKWNIIENANGYEIVYSTSKKFTKKTTKTKLIKKPATSKITFKKLKSGKKYFVKMRAFKTVNNKKIYGVYSKVKSVKVK